MLQDFSTVVSRSIPAREHVPGHLGTVARATQLRSNASRAACLSSSESGGRRWPPRTGVQSGCQIHASC
eukprot:10001117-Lingulodinium_polyedra.AAC.1